MRRILLILIPIMLTVMLIGCGETMPSPAVPAEEQIPLTPEPEKSPPQQIEPQVIKEWSGTGIKTTEPFTIKEQPWIIQWEHEPVIMEGQSMGILQIMVYETKNPDIPITLAANSMEKGSDISYIYETGEFYLTINAANTNWSVKVLAK